MNPITAVLDLFKLRSRARAREPMTSGASPEPTQSVRQFSQMAVPRGIRQTPAPWLINRNEYVTHIKNSAYIAIGCVARKAAMQSPEVLVVRETKAGTEEQSAPRDHPLVQLFQRINAFHSLYDYIYYTVGWRLATGDSFAWKARNGLGMVTELWPLPSQWCHAIPSETEFIGQYKVEGVWGQVVYWPARDIIHISDPNLDWSGSGRYYGRPTMGAAGTMIDIEEAMMSRMLNWFQNYAPPGMVFSGAEGIGPDQIWQLYQVLAEQHALNEASGRPFVVPEGFKLETGAMTGPKEIDYSAQLKTTLEMILAVFGVPPAIAGIVKDVNRANMIGSMMSFAENTVNPLLLHLSQHHTQNLAREFDEKLIVRFPPCTVDDAEQMRKSFESAAKAGAVTPNDIREHMLRMPVYLTGGDRPLVQGAQIEASFGNVDEKVLAEEAAAKEEKERAAKEEATAKLEAMRSGQNDNNEGAEPDRGATDGKEPAANGKPPRGKAKATAASKLHENNGSLDARRQAILDTVDILLRRRQGVNVVDD